MIIIMIIIIVIIILIIVLIIQYTIVLISIISALLFEDAPQFELVARTTIRWSTTNFKAVLSKFLLI